jgi:hypothetical protein
MITQASAQSLAKWLLTEHPSIFYAIAKGTNPSLGAFSDILENVGGAFSSAVSSVGSWLSNPQNIQSLTALAGTYFAANAASDAAKAQARALQTQVDRAQAGQTAAPITYAYDANNNPVPVYTGSTAIPGLGSQLPLPSGQIGYALTPQSLTALQPSFLQKYGLWLGVGAAGLLIVAAITRG